VIEWILQRARTYIFSTALPAVSAAAAHEAVVLLEEDGTLVAALHDRVAQFRAATQALGARRPSSPTAIQPVILGAADAALDASRLLAERGFLVPAIRPPTVPAGTSRLRVSLSAAHAHADVRSLAGALQECLA